MNASEYTEEMFQNFLSGNATWYGHSFNPRDRDALDKAIKDGYLKARKSEHGLINAFWFWSAVSQRPYIRITPRRVYSSVEYDFIYTDDRFTEKACEGLFEIAKRAATLKDSGFVAWGRTFGIVSRITTDNAEEYAKALVTYSLEPSNLTSWADSFTQSEA